MLRTSRESVLRTSRESVLRTSRESVLRTSRESVLRTTGDGFITPSFLSTIVLAYGPAYRSSIARAMSGDDGQNPPGAPGLRV